MRLQENLLHRQCPKRLKKGLIGDGRTAMFRGGRKHQYRTLEDVVKEDPEYISLLAGGRYLKRAQGVMQQPSTMVLPPEAANANPHWPLTRVSTT